MKGEGGMEPEISIHTCVFHLHSFAVIRSPLSQEKYRFKLQGTKLSEVTNTNSCEATLLLRPFRNHTPTYNVTNTHNDSRARVDFDRQRLLSNKSRIVEAVLPCTLDICLGEAVNLSQI